MQSMKYGILGLLLINIVSSSTTLKILPNNIDVISESSITVEVAIDDVNELHAASVTITFDSELVEFDRYVRGDFLEDNNGGYSVIRFLHLLPNETNPTSIKLDLTILGPGSSTGSGILFYLKFIPINAGDCYPEIIDYSLKDIDNNSVLADTYSSVFNIYANLNVKVYLEGAYSDGLMRTTLNQENHLPLNQPYNSAPWFYEGAEAVTETFMETHTTIVDWVLIELRDSEDISSIISRTAAFLKEDGNILNIDGSESLSMDIENDTYYIAVFHRNHLAVISSVPSIITFESGIYDFSDAESKAYGNAALINLDENMWGMIAGDANGNGQIQNNDIESFWKVQVGQSGYCSSDFNLNGQVQNNDKEAFWRIHNGLGVLFPIN